MVANPITEALQSGRAPSTANGLPGDPQQSPASTPAHVSAASCSQALRESPEEDCASAERPELVQQTAASLCSSEGVSEFLSLSSGDVPDLASEVVSGDSVVDRGPNLTGVLPQEQPGGSGGRTAE